MSQLFVDDIVSKEGTKSVAFSKGINVSVASTFSGDVSIAGTLTYEDVTNIDSVGIITARGGIEIGASAVGGTISAGGNVIFTGITTIGTGLSFADDIKAKFGASGDLEIYHNGSNSIIKDSGTGDLKIQGAADVVIEDTSGSNSAVFNTDGAVELYDRGASAGKKFETVGTGISVFGPEGGNGQVFINADEADDNADRFALTVNTTGNFFLQNFNQGSWANNIKAEGNGSVELYDAGSQKLSTTGYGVTVSGGACLSGLTTAFGGLTVAGTLVESMSSTTTAYNTSGDLNITNGNFHFSSANLGGTGTTLNIMSTAGINTTTKVNQVLNVTAVTAVNATSAFVNKVTIDGKATGITTHWGGGSVPSDGGGSGVDTYSFNILKTGNETYIIVANQIKTS